MKGLIIYTGRPLDQSAKVRDFGEPLYKTVGAAVGGHIEIVHPVGLPYPLLMIVNEEGLLRGLDFNPIASVLYGMLDHGQPIVGNAVIMKEGYVDGEPDVVGLDPEDVRAISKLHPFFFGGDLDDAD